MNKLEISLINYLEKSFAANKKQVAIETEKGILTYDALNNLTNQLATKLKEKTLSGEFVGIESAKCAFPIVAMIAAIKACRPFVIIDPRDSNATNFSKVKMLGINLLLVKGKSLGEVELSDSFKYQSEGSTSRFYPRDDLLQASNSIAYAIYTSGSTGKPKCVVVDSKSLGLIILDHIERLKVSNTSRTLQFSRLTFDGCITEIFWTLLSGACLVSLAESKLMPGEALQQTLEKYRITHLKTTPFALTVTNPTVKMNIQHVVNGGGACRNAMVEKWSKFASFYNAYGTTETSVCNFLSSPLNPKDCQRGIPMGDIVGDCSYYIRSSNCNDSMQSTEKGELIITGKSVALGYLDEHNLIKFTEENTLSEYQTGDIVERKDDKLYFVERCDRQLKVRGYRIEPGEVERVACQLPEVREAVVLSSQEDSQQAVLHCYYVGEVSQKTLRNYLSANLDSFKVPSSYHLLSEFPYTKNGKVDRNKLNTSLLNKSKNRFSEENDHPIIQFMKEQTGIMDITEEDSFISVGGDSLSILLLIDKLRHLGWTDAGVKDVLQAPSLKALVNKLSMKREALVCAE